MNLGSQHFHSRRLELKSKALPHHNIEIEGMHVDKAFSGLILVAFTLGADFNHDSWTDDLIWIRI